ncbi:acyl-CoA thioesterase/BAAT N-terminal domain-containing protein [Leuconostoc citreum]|uniref:acyl-CoA thioester hydrolase/BAAT C-terminal domain-containing protein n=1 Tax=Leuconostoc citreum TaxID=33964 RepID=UPI00200A3B18|nr:acyl-CoA thioester hydrolase/BAAT C-terminal domain-containing protein [Leuconostoc citreum]MCK8605016.1 acyl-CoA thioesterase/BAAT N-terminal domain-containing protein [Leuconostoc citreum]
MKHFKIQKNSSAVDEIIKMQLEKLPPLTKVEIVVRTVTPYYCINAPKKISKNCKWESKNTFRSNSDGLIDLNTFPSLAGTYSGVYPMGCLTFLIPSKKNLLNKEQKSNKTSFNEFCVFEITALLDGEILDQCRIKRFFVNKNIKHKLVESNTFQGRFFYPENETNLPAILILSGSEGGIEKAQAIAQLIANHGFATLAIGYFGIGNLTKDLSRIPLEIIEDSISFFKSQKMIDSKHISIYGRSKGAEFALLAASYFSEINCVVVNSPSNVVYEGISNKGFPTRTSSWSYRGKNINYFPFSFKTFFLSKITHKDFPLINENSSCEIPVEKINGNILCIASSKDEIWNALQASKRIQKRLAKYNFQHQFNSNYVENAGHMLTIPCQPNSRYKNIDKKLLMNDTYETWNNTVSHFKDNLKQNSYQL